MQDRRLCTVLLGETQMPVAAATVAASSRRTAGEIHSVSKSHPADVVGNGLLPSDGDDLRVMVRTSPELRSLVMYLATQSPRRRT